MECHKGFEHCSSGVFPYWPPEVGGEDASGMQMWTWGCLRKSRHFSDQGYAGYATFPPTPTNSRPYRVIIKGQ